MEELGSLWTYQEGIDELKQKLLYATIELESFKQEATQEMIKNKENVRNLLNLLQISYKERDEAKNQLQRVMNKLMFFTEKANSTVTESNSQSHGSSPADSFFDAVSSPDLSMADSGKNKNPNFGNQGTDPSCMVIENIAKGKRLPEKGKLLQAVMEAGPLLQTLLVAGPLPRWRNPPPLQVKIPAVAIGGQRASSSQMCSTSMLNFSGGNSGFGSQIPAGKRQKFY